MKDETGNRYGVATLNRPAITRLPPRGFTREAVDALAAGRREPNWMVEKRHKGWYHYEEMEPPFWRRTDIQKLNWDDLVPFAPDQAPTSSLEGLPPKLHSALAAYGERAGLMLQRDSGHVYSVLGEEAQRQGVVWTDMHTAVREYGELVRPRFMEAAVPATTDRFTALHAAFWSGGTFLYVPRNVVIDAPFVSVLWLEMPQLAVFPPTLIVAEEGSSVTVVSELLSMGCQACPSSYHGGVTELFVGPGAQVRFVNSQEFGDQVYDLRQQTAILERDSRLDWLTVNLGGALSRSTQRSSMRGPGAEARLTGLYLPAGNQHVAFETLQDHIAGNCLSDLLYQGALLGKSRAVYEGTIRARPGAQKTNAYQSNRNLLLSAKARADSLPRLEIEANDLRCTHGATVSQVDEDMVFYLMTRGIPRAEAVRLIVEGFFQPALDRLPSSLDGLRERLTHAIATRLQAK